MKNTENFNLKLPEATDIYSIEDFNENTKKIDNLLAGMIKFSTITQKNSSSAHSIGADEAAEVSINMTPTEGYTIVGVIGVNPHSTKVCVTMFHYGTDGRLVVGLKNVTDDAVPMNLTVHYLEVKTELLG